MQFDRFFLYLIDLRNNAKEEKLRTLLGKFFLFAFEIYLNQIQMGRRGDCTATRSAKPSSPPACLKRMFCHSNQLNHTRSTTTALTLVHTVPAPTSSWAPSQSIWTPTTPSLTLLASSAQPVGSPVRQSLSLHGMSSKYTAASKNDKQLCIYDKNVSYDKYISPVAIQCSKPSWQVFTPMDNVGKKCSKPPWQAFTPPPLFGQSPFGNNTFQKGISLKDIIICDQRGIIFKIFLDMHITEVWPMWNHVKD